MIFSKKHFLLSLGISSLLFSGTAAPLVAWTTGIAISDGISSLNPTPSSLTIDQNSNAIVGWLAGEVGSDTNLFTVSLPAGAPHWNDPVALYSGASPEFPSFPILSADNNGIVHSAWSNFHFGETAADETRVVSSTQNTLGSSWSTPIISSAFSGFPSNGAGNCDELGNQIGILALAADSNTYSPPYSINLFALAHDGSEWTTPINLGTDNLEGQAVIFSSAATGKAVLGWRIGPNLSLKSARYDIATNDLTPINDISLPNGTTDIGFARSALALNGNAILVFGAQLGADTNYVIYSSFLPAGSDTWTFPEPVSDPANNTTGLFLSIKTDNNALSTIAWGELTQDNNGFIRVGSLSFGGSLTNIHNLTDSNPLVGTTGDGTSGVMVDADNFGNKVVIWQLISDSIPTVQIASSTSGGDWSASQTLSTTGFSPKVSLSAQGTAVAVWVDSVSNFLYASNSNHLFALAGPSSFGGYISSEGSVSYLNMHWNESLAPNIVSYEIFKDAELVANVSGTGPFTHKQTLECNSVDGDYTLVAVASNGNKSIPLAITISE